jgi:hypothetical protein
MAKLSIGIGSTSRSEYIYILDITSTSGAGKTGIVYNTSGLSGHFVRSAGSATSISFVTQTATGAWVSGGFAEVSSTLMPGIYRVDIPDIVFSSGSDKSIVMIRGASNTVPVTLEYQLVGSDPSLVLSNSSIANTTWSYTSRTITGGIADTVTTLTNRAGFSITGGIADTVSTLTNRAGFSITGGIADTVTTLTNRAGFSITGGIADTVTTLTNRAGFSITGGIADTVTTLSNRAGFAITGNADKTGYSLSQSFPANFSSLSISGGKVSIVQSDINSIIASIPEVNYSGIAATTWNFLSSAIGNTLSIGYQLINNLDTTVSSRSTLTSKQVISAIQTSVRTVSQVNKDKISKL